MKNNTKRVILIMGGAASGKSLFAEKYADKLGKKVLYVATAIPDDTEMESKIKVHRKRRKSTWTTLEIVPEKLGTIPDKFLKRSEGVLVDGLGIWIARRMAGHTKGNIKNILTREIVSFIDKVSNVVPLIIVSDETGMGIVPITRVARDFRDTLGHINQKVAKKSDEIYFIVAGMPIQIKPEPGNKTGVK